jgi:hypothetical protein
MPCARHDTHFEHGSLQLAHQTIQSGVPGLENGCQCLAAFLRQFRDMADGVLGYGQLAGQIHDRLEASGVDRRVCLVICRSVEGEDRAATTVRRASPSTVSIAAFKKRDPRPASADSVALAMRFAAAARPACRRTLAATMPPTPSGPSRLRSRFLEQQQLRFQYFARRRRQQLAVRTLRSRRSSMSH